MVTNPPNNMSLQSSAQSNMALCHPWKSEPDDTHCGRELPNTNLLHWEGHDLRLQDELLLWDSEIPLSGSLSSLERSQPKSETAM